VNHGDSKIFTTISYGKPHFHIYAHTEKTQG